jgi:hypothetical protein
MRGTYQVKGFYQDFNTGELFRAERMQINITKDKLGCTVSIGAVDKGIQLTVPFDGVIKDLIGGK